MDPKKVWGDLSEVVTVIKEAIDKYNQDAGTDALDDGLIMMALQLSSYFYAIDNKLSHKDILETVNVSHNIYKALKQNRETTQETAPNIFNNGGESN